MIAPEHMLLPMSDADRMTSLICPAGQLPSSTNTLSPGRSCPSPGSDFNKVASARDATKIKTIRNKADFTVPPWQRSDHNAPRTFSALRSNAHRHRAKYLLGGEALELEIAIPQYRCVGQGGAEVQQKPTYNCRFHGWNYREKVVMFYFAAIKVQVVPVRQRLFATINRRQ